MTKLSINLRLLVLSLFIGLSTVGNAQTQKVFGANTISSTASIGANVYDTVSYASGIEFNEFSFLYDTASGSNDITVKVQAVDGGNLELQAGLMVRNSLSGNAPFQAVYVDGNRTLKIVERWTTNGAVHQRDLKYLKRTERVWLRIEKRDSLNPIYYKFNKNGTWLHLDNSVLMGDSSSYYAGMMTAGGMLNDSVPVHYKKFNIVSTTPLRTAYINSDIKLYPNPAGNTISTTTNLGDFVITDMVGKVVLKGDNSTQIDISTLPSGIYVFKGLGLISRFNKL